MAIITDPLLGDIDQQVVSVKLENFRIPSTFSFWNYDLIKNLNFAGDIFSGNMSKPEFLQFAEKLGLTPNKIRVDHNGGHARQVLVIPSGEYTSYY